MENDINNYQMNPVILITMSFIFIVYLITLNVCKQRKIKYQYKQNINKQKSLLAYFGFHQHMLIT